MRKQQKQLIIMLAVLVLLGAGYLGLRKYNQVQSEKTVEETGEVLVSLAAEDIVRFSYDYDGTEYAYEKENDVWHYTADPELTLTQSSLTNIAASMAYITAEDTISEVTDLEQYGLSEPSRTFSFETSAQSYEFHVGDYNEITGTYYICRPGETTVYTVRSSAITVMDLDVMDIVPDILFKPGAA